MKEYLKCYHVFMVWPLLRALVYVLYPLWVVFMGIMALNVSELMILLDVSPKTIYLILGSAMITMELTQAMFVWVGIAGRDTNKLSYLMTSVKGKEVLKKALWADVFRRWVTIIGLYVVLYVISPGILSVTNWLAAMIITGLSAEIGQLLVRLEASVTINTVVFMMVNLVGDALVAGALFLNLNAVVLLIPLMFAVWMSWLNINTVMKNERESYYDKRIEENNKAA